MDLWSKLCLPIPLRKTVAVNSVVNLTQCMIESTIYIRSFFIFFYLKVRASFSSDTMLFLIFVFWSWISHLYRSFSSSNDDCIENCKKMVERFSFFQSCSESVGKVIFFAIHSLVTSSSTVSRKSTQYFHYLFH